MKSLYYFICGLMVAITLVLFTIDFWGREFIQDYWIQSMWYGELKPLYRAITTIIIFIDCVLLYITGLIHSINKCEKENSTNN